MDNLYTCLHYIDVDQKNVELKEIAKEDADEYIS